MSDERKSWNKWIWSSVAKHMKITAASLNLPLLVEGVDSRQSANVESSHAELRLNGPFYYEISRELYQLQMPINILLLDYMTGDEQDAYRLQNWMGTFAAIMDHPIPIYRYGQNVEDDRSFLDCLRIKKTKDGGVRQIFFGQVGRMGTIDIQVREAAIDGLFEVFLHTNINTNTFIP